MENKYIRDLKAEERPITSEKDVKYIGFFGATSEPVYQQIKHYAEQKRTASTENCRAEYLVDENLVPCNCTD